MQIKSMVPWLFSDCCDSLMELHIDDEKKRTEVCKKCGKPANSIKKGSGPVVNMNMKKGPRFGTGTVHPDGSYESHQGTPPPQHF